MFILQHPKVTFICHLKEGSALQEGSMTSIISIDYDLYLGKTAHKGRNKGDL